MRMRTEALKDNRLTVRASEEITILIKNAAELSGMSLSQFIIEATTSKAHEEIERHQKFKLSFETAEKVFAIFDNPPPPNQNLINAAKRYKAKSDGQHKNIKQST